MPPRPPDAPSACRRRTVGALDHVLVHEGDHRASAASPRSGSALGVVLTLASRGVRALTGDLGYEPLRGPRSGRPGRSSARTRRSARAAAQRHLDAGHGQAGLGDDPDRLLLEPAVAERAPVGAVEQRGEAPAARAAAPTQCVEAPPKVRTPDLTPPFGVVEHRLEPIRWEERGEVAHRAGCRGRLRDQTNPIARRPRPRSRVRWTRPGPDRGCRSDAAPGSSGTAGGTMPSYRHSAPAVGVRGDGAGRLRPNTAASASCCHVTGMGGVAEDASADRHEHAGGDEAAPLLHGRRSIASRSGPVRRPSIVRDRSAMVPSGSRAMSAEATHGV